VKERRIKKDTFHESFFARGECAFRSKHRQKKDRWQNNGKKGVTKGQTKTTPREVRDDDKGAQVGRAAVIQGGTRKGGNPCVL